MTLPNISNMGNNSILNNSRVISFHMYVIRFAFLILNWQFSAVFCSFNVILPTREVQVVLGKLPKIEKIL